MLTPVSVALPDNKEPTKTMVRDIVTTFLTKEWPFVDPETLTTSYHALFANRHCRVERPKPTIGIPTEPLRVFIKFHKGTGVDMETFKHLVPSKHQEALVKGATTVMHAAVLLKEEVKELQEANAMKKRIQEAGVLTVREGQDIIQNVAVEEQIRVEMQRRQGILRRCGRYREVGHNARTFTR